jgi:hypothetical protein
MIFQKSQRRTYHTKPDPKSMGVMPFCIWGVLTRLD